MKLTCKANPSSSASSPVPSLHSLQSNIRLAKTGLENKGAREGRGPEHVFMKDKATQGQRTKIQRKLPCKGWMVEYDFIKDNATNHAIYRSGEKAIMGAPMLEPKRGLKARASLHERHGDTFWNEQVLKRSSHASAKGLSMCLSRKVSHFVQYTRLEWEFPCKGQSWGPKVIRKFENVFSKSRITTGLFKLGMTLFSVATTDWESSKEGLKPQL